MILDVSGVSTGQPVYIPKPGGIDGKKLKKFLRVKGVNLPTAVANLIADSTIWCHAFYYSKDVVLMMFALKSETGLIKSLTGDANLGNLFKSKGFTVRLIKCPRASIKVLEKYVASLAA
jgi:hypothetical protein